MKVRRILTFSVMFIMLGTVGFGERRTDRASEVYSATEVVVGQCDGFEIWADWTAFFQFIDLYDKNGTWIWSVSHERVLGHTLYYNSANPTKYVLGGPGEGVQIRWDPATGRQYSSGMVWKVKVPGHGLILAESGASVWQCDPYTFENCQLVSDVGHNQFHDDDLDALCNYLK